jgi:predicted AlkP superfamily pyrophosphatase or phosphodiesterase
MMNLMSTCKFLLFAIPVFFTGTLTLVHAQTQQDVNKPKLVVMITVDQLRGEMPWKYKDRFGKGGFRYLMDNGVSYTNANYRHSTTFTAVGHATLATGGNGSEHGLAGNDWYNQETEKRVYCVEDDWHTIIGKERKDHKGTSPRNLTSSTIGDELVMASGLKSRVFSVSIKDRGAILPGGHLGKAFWYGKKSGQFVSSTYYYDKYPKWVDAWNAKKVADKWQTQSWTLLQDKSKYVYSNQDDREVEKSYKSLGRTFPHKLGNEKAGTFYSMLRFTPMGDELTLDFTKELMKQEKVGQGKVTDMLAVSFSATDYLGHAFGPNSLEAEDNILRMDKLLADFFSYIDKTVGLDNTLIFLSSDHGTDAVPEFRTQLGITGAGRHYPEKFIIDVNAALQKRFNTTDEMVSAFWNPSLYLNMKTMSKLDLDVAAVEVALAEEILKVPGVALALTRTQLLKGEVTANPIINKVQRAFHPKRSGNVLIVQDQYWYLYPNADQFSAMHGSPYNYDTHVPIMFAGPGIGSKTIDRAVGPEDIAATVATYLGIPAPSGSVGEALFEVTSN